jgi:hypothetical protein
MFKDVRQVSANSIVHKRRERLVRFIGSGYLMKGFPKSLLQVHAGFMPSDYGIPLHVQ